MSRDYVVVIEMVEKDVESLVYICYDPFLLRRLLSESIKWIYLCDLFNAIHFAREYIVNRPTLSWNM
jgi:hypothetical protein